MKTVHRRIVMGIVIALLPAFAACYESGSSQEDAVTDDAAAGDGHEDQAETADQGSDAGEDAPTEQPQDVPDVPVEVPTACESSGGYCSSYMVVVTDPCVTCADQGGTHYRPAPGTDGAMGCSIMSPNMDPWCCQPESTDMSQCESGGGECYAGDPAMDICPPGWMVSRAMCNETFTVCCMTGDSCARE